MLIALTLLWLSPTAKDLIRIASAGDSATSGLLTAEQTYARLAQQRGMKGVQQLMTSDFRIRSGHGWTKRKDAIAELTKYLDIGYNRYSLSVLNVQHRGNRAAVVVREDATVKIASRGEGTATWIWRHRWRLTPAGWRLAAIDHAPEHFLKADPIIRFTFGR